MKRFGIVLILTLSSGLAAAKCIHDRAGQRVCGRGHCIVDYFGQAFCASAKKGQCIIDSFGVGHCGAGECIDDGDHLGVCSQIEGGVCWLNQNAIGICE